MDAFLKDKITNCYKYIKDKIIPENPDLNLQSSNIKTEDNLRLIERNKRIFYFSDFTLNVDEMLAIIDRINIIKECTFKKLLESMTFICKGNYIIFYYNLGNILSFANTNNLNENILKLFTVCFLHYYGNYKINLNFNNFYTQDFINHLASVSLKIENGSQFKIFCFAFFQEISRCFFEYKYIDNQLLFEVYNPSIVMNVAEIDREIKNLDLNNNDKNYSNNLMEIFKGYQNIITSKFSKMKNTLITPLISATERVVDMVLAVNYTNYIFLMFLV